MRKEKDTRKLIKNGRGSYYINLPKNVAHILRWKERQKLIVKRSGKKIIITDWPASPKPIRGKKK